jgi:hypothetical protein
MAFDLWINASKVHETTSMRRKYQLKIFLRRLGSIDPTFPEIQERLNAIENVLWNFL